jgi:hypothetical protein
VKGRAAVLVIGALIVGGCGANPSPAPISVPPPTLPIASPARDFGAGTPGTFCATNRLGKRFTKDGVVYVCKGPKPYRWRRTS